MSKGVLAMGTQVRDRIVSDIEREKDLLSILLEQDSKVALITWNPKPKLYSYNMWGQNDYRMQWEWMLTQLKQLNRCCKAYCIMPEVSEKGKLHCHGWIWITDNVKWQKSIRPMFYKAGNLRLNKCNSISATDYHYKDLDETIQFLMPYAYFPFTASNSKGMLKEVYKERFLEAWHDPKTVAHRHKYNLSELFYID